MKFIITDVETTGLDASRDKLLEIAMLALDEDWQALDRRQYVVAQPSWSRSALLHRTDEYVVNMHTDNGLWDEVYGPDSCNRSTVDNQLATWIKGLKESDDEEVRVVGNSLRLDLNFIDHHLPLVQEQISYRSIDVSAVETFLDYGLNLPKFPRPVGSTHRAMDDVEACYAQMLYHRNNLKGLMA